MIDEEITDSSGRICSSNSAFTIQNQFSLLEEISSNGYNRLVKAMRYGKFFMLKGLKEKYRNDKTYIALLFKEFDILLSMNHPTIVRAYSVEEVEDLGMCIVMDYIDGNILSEYLLSEPSSSNKRRIIKQLLKAMSYFQDMQCVHRDLKPTNILITNNGKNVKIIDFGLSDTDDYAVFKEPAFTRYYASPEQLEGGKLDCRSDIYSFGRILQQIFPYKYKKVVQKCTKTKREFNTGFADINCCFSAKKDGKLGKCRNFASLN